MKEQVELIRQKELEIVELAKLYSANPTEAINKQIEYKKIEMNNLTFNILIKCK